MYDIAEQVRTWRDEGREVDVAVLVATRGFSSAAPGAALAWTRGAEPVGELVGGISVETVTAAPNCPTGLVEVTISENQALAAGLACGGTATLLVQPAAALTEQFWAQVLDHRPVCLVTVLGGPDTEPRSQAYAPAEVAATRDIAGGGDRIPRLFARGVTGADLVENAATGERAAALVLWPVPTLVVVGDGLIGQALQATGRLLGWSVELTPAVDEAVAAIGRLQHSDAVVVLSHDRAVDGPALSAALAGAAGYVGALGSRRTQAARGQWLEAHGVDADARGRIHGPAGLDLDAHTPGEIAISIVAEILAERSAATGGALRDRPGPVHVAGVQAPPPRY